MKILCVGRIEGMAEYPPKEGSKSTTTVYRAKVYCKGRKGIEVDAMLPFVEHNGSRSVDAVLLEKCKNLQASSQLCNVEMEFSMNGKFVNFDLVSVEAAE